MRGNTQLVTDNSQLSGLLFVSHVMKTKAIAFLMSSVCFGALAELVITRPSSSVASEVKKAASDSLLVYQQSGMSGLVGVVSGCWRAPRDFCLYLDFASHRIALGARYTGVELDKYFYRASVAERGRTWLAPNGRGQVANDQYLDAVDHVMTRTLVKHRDKLSESRP